MSNSQRVPRASDEIQELFRTHLNLLVGYCREFDAGDEGQALPMSVSLRTFLYKKVQKDALPLLEQVGLWSGDFFSMAPHTWRYSPNPCPQCDFVHVDARGYITRLPAPSELDRVPIDRWWGEDVIMGRRPLSEQSHRSDEPNPTPLPQTMSRKDIVKSMADMEAAHVDKGLSPLYRSFTSGEFLGWERDQAADVIKLLISQNRAAGDGPAKYYLGPQYGCVRAIAHEFLLTMQEYAPASFKAPYTYKATAVPHMNLAIEADDPGPRVVMFHGCAPGQYMFVKDTDWAAKKK